MEKPRDCEQSKPCDIVRVDDQGNEIKNLTELGFSVGAEVESPNYICKTCGRVLYSWEIGGD